MNPTAEIAAKIASEMTGETVISCHRMLTGEQNFIYAVDTSNAQYVIRMTGKDHRDTFVAAINWQNKLIPLGVPLAPFILVDLDGHFPALLMHRLPGDDLCNVYVNLTAAEKKSLALEIVSIQAKTLLLPKGNYFGICSSYEQTTEYTSWFDFLLNRLEFCQPIIMQAKIFDDGKINNVIKLIHKIKHHFDSITPIPFLWDASERNVIIQHAKISGIVDVDELCFGDPLLVIGLTATALESLGLDTLYTDYWAEALNLDESARLRLAFYRLFYVVMFMRKQSMTSNNKQIISFDVEKLNAIYDRCFIRLNNNAH